MDSPRPEQIRAAKQSLRADMRRRRRALVDRPALGRHIWRRLMELPEYEAAETVMGYVDHAAEVPTRPWFDEIWRSGRRLVVPYCQQPELGLFLLTSLDQLAPGTLGILEPAVELRPEPGHAVALEQIDLVLVPGVAFDRMGNRLGQGGGYYDRLLGRLGRQARAVGLAFECQMVDRAPILPHDVRLDKVVTERAVYGSDAP